MMILSEEQNGKAKEKIKSAWAEGDLWGLFCAGLDNFMNVLFTSVPISFHRFLEDTGAFFDQYIQEVSDKEQLRYIGGKMILELENKELPNPSTIHLSADFYFQTRDKKWTVKKKTGKITTDRFSDWETCAESRELKNTGKMELSIEPPESGKH